MEIFNKMKKENMKTQEICYVLSRSDLRINFLDINKFN